MVQMKQYLISVYHAEGFAPSPEEMEKIFRDVGALNDEMVAAGAFVTAGGLQPTGTARVARLRDDGQVETTDGPFIQAPEPIGGFWLIKAPDDETALEWCRKATRANRVPNEVRALQEEA
jgi:hypothetical protein